MNVYHIGKLIESERKRRGVTQKQLASGIFAYQMLYKLETNESESDKLQVDILLQRLGRSPDKLEIFMSALEYQKIRARDLIEELILKKKADKVEYMLERYREYYGENNNVHMMYYNRTKAYLILRVGGDINEALKYIVTALDWTLPKWNKNEFKNYLISTYEMENLLVYGKILYLLGRVEEARIHLEKCIEYIECQYIDADTEEYAKIYPKCVWLLAKVYSESESDDRIVELCEKALNYLRREAIGYFAIPIMEELIIRYNRMGNTQRELYWNRFYNALKSMYEMYAPEKCLDSLFSNVCQGEYHLDYETIKGERISRGYSQGELSEGVYYDSKPISLIESHKRAANKQCFEKIMNKLEIDKRRYNGLLATDSFEVLQKKNVIDYFCCICDIDSANVVLTELEELLDKNVEDNMRFINIYRIIIESMCGKISAEDALERCRILLNQTYNIEVGMNRAPMRNEAIIINQIGIFLGELGRATEKIELLGKVEKFYEESKVDIKYNVRSYMMLDVNYVNALYDAKKKDKALAHAERMLREELIFAKTRTLSDYCIILVCGNIKMEDRKVWCEKLLRSAYYMEEFNYNTVAMKTIANYYEMVFGKCIQ